MNDDVIALFHELADLSPSAREEYYAQRQIPSAVRSELESLLRFDGEGDSLSGPIAAAADEVLRRRTSLAAGRRCGPYRLVRLLGRGGMGAVYLAERADGQVEQRVAIKFVRPGADLPALRERFLRERRILASLNHPGIARLLDVGHTSDGQPYFVMEYIDGSPIDDYSEKLGVREVLQLFLQVFEPVSYAHRNLIVHRDLKPSNILIDSAGRLKLLDFGIAKILDTANDAQTLVRALTPDYASPEQMGGEAHTTATDIYSLGAVLYRLLTSRPPRMNALGSPQADIPPASSVNADIPRDVDFIVRKALRKEPEQRYATVDAFAEDIRAFLESRPVRARAGNAWYRARKFLRRYWLPAAATAVAVFGLAAGLYVANAQRAVALRRFSQVRQLSNEVFALDNEMASLPGATKARHALVTMSLHYLERLGQDARGDKELALEVGSAYLKVARVQGVPTNTSLGQMAEAEESLRKANAFIDSVLTASPRDRTALLRSAEINTDRMILAQTARHNDQALAYGRRAAEQIEAARRSGPPEPPDADLEAGFYGNIALAHLNMHRMDEGVRYGRRGVEIARTGHAPLSLAGCLSTLSNALRYRGDLEESLQTIREAETVFARSVAADSRRKFDLFNALWREGLVLGEDGAINMDRPQEAVIALQKAFDLADEIVRQDPSDYTSRARLAMAARELGDIVRHSDPQRALAIYDYASHRSAEVKNTKAARDQVWLLAGSSYPLRRLHRTAESKQRIDSAFELLRQTKDYPAQAINPGEEADATLRALGDYYAETDQPIDAVRTYQELLDKVMASRPAPETDLRHANELSVIYRRLEELQRTVGNADAAAALGQRRQELWQHWDGELPNNPFVKRQLAASSRY